MATGARNSTLRQQIVATQIAAGAYHSVVACDDGTIARMGSGGYTPGVWMPPETMTGEEAAATVPIHNHVAAGGRSTVGVQWRPHARPVPNFRASLASVEGGSLRKSLRGLLCSGRAPNQTDVQLLEDDGIASPLLIEYTD